MSTTESTTTSSQTSQTSQTGGSTGPFNSIFQSAGGPPLILVCIAAGLLLGAFIGVLLMRRLRPGGTVIIHRVHGRPAVDVFPKFGEKPRLLDIHIQVVPAGAALGTPGMGKGKGVEALESPWAPVSPFAATYLESDPSTDAETRTATPRAKFLRLTRFMRSTSPAAPPSSTASARAGAPRAARLLQLAVTVSMPSPRAPAYASGPDTDSGRKVYVSHENDIGNGNEDAHPDCVIGTLVASYHPPADAP